MPTSAHVDAALSATCEGDALQIALAPSFAMGIVDIAMANSLGLLMGNAVANEQRGQTISTSALSVVLAMILKNGVSS